jgi:hypothetical protein
MFDTGVDEYYMTKTKFIKERLLRLEASMAFTVLQSPLAGCRSNFMDQRWEADGMRFNEQGRKNERTMMHEIRHGHDTGIESQIPAV